VFQFGQDLSLGHEAAQVVNVVERTTHHLQCDLLLELTVHAFGQEHLPHAAPPQNLHQPIGPDALPGLHASGLRPRCQLLQRQRIIGIMLPEHRFEF
jgi:hypothetical protein